jgi:hypothetical protein
MFEIDTNAEVHIAKKGEAVHILGSWFGNGVAECAAWTLNRTQLNGDLQYGTTAIQSQKLAHTMYVTSQAPLPSESIAVSIK